MSETILLVEDDDALRGALRRYLTRAGRTVIEASTCAEAFTALEREASISIVLSDVLLPDGLGFELVDRAGRLSMPPSVIIMTGDDRIDNAIAALHRGASDFLLKPFAFEALETAIERANGNRSVAVTNVPKPKPNTPQGAALEDWRRKYAPALLGSDPRFMRVFTIMERVADTDCTVLVTGESGTGKELIARALHSASERRNKPFVTVNCAAIPENLLESELFGHVRGAFTGATNSRVGRFTAADGGTLFLDEIGELPVTLQAKLLRVLQEKEVSPVGESRSHRVDVRVIAATNRDLEAMVEAGTFREDLVYRLNVIPIELPALRERPDDIAELIGHFVKRSNERRDRHIDGVSDAAMEAMKAYDWPGNVRQLENTIERMVVLKTEGPIELEDLPPKVRLARKAPPAGVNVPALPDDGIDLRDAVEQFENALILQALERTGWNKNRAAAILRMNRTTLVEKLKKKNFDDSTAAA